ncbi:MAG: hypothetical protein AAFW65_08485, partial [Pseudomonadota bacterium]
NKAQAKAEARRDSAKHRGVRGRLAPNIAFILSARRNAVSARALHLNRTLAGGPDTRTHPTVPRHPRPRSGLRAHLWRYSHAQ